MSSQDAAFLYAEDASHHMQIGVVALFEGPAPSRELVQDMIASKLDRVARYRQRVQLVPFDLGVPVWADDPHFDLAYHIRRSAVPAPGSGAELHALVGRLMSHKLDRDRPLWELWIVEGLEQGRWALISKTHHCLVDGVAGSGLMALLLDRDPKADYTPAEPWQPRPGPSLAALVASSVRTGLLKPQQGIRNLGHAMRTPRRALRELAEFVDGLASFRALRDHEVESSLAGPIGPHRRWHGTSIPLATIEEIRHEYGGTLNDIALTAIAGGFRSLLISRGEPVKGRFVRSLVPVSVRSADERERFDNRVAAVFVDLPMEFSDSALRLAAIRRAMDEVKRHHQAGASEALASLAAVSPTALLAFGARRFNQLDQRWVQTVTTNVRGPAEPYFAAGRRMLHAYPYVPLAGPVRIAVAVFSYAGTLDIGITGDYETASDIGVLATGFERVFSELASATRPRRSRER